MAKKYIDAVREAYRSVAGRDIKEMIGNVFPEAVRLAAERVLAHYQRLAPDVLYQDMLRRFRFYVDTIPDDRLVHIDSEKGHVILNARALSGFSHEEPHHHAEEGEDHRWSRVRHIIKESVAYELQKWHIMGEGVGNDKGKEQSLALGQEGNKIISRDLELALLITPTLLLATAAFNIASLAERNMSGMAVGTASSLMGAVFLLLAVLVAAHTLKKESDEKEP